MKNVKMPQAKACGIFAISGFQLREKKQISGSDICFIGAGDRTRTGTPSLAADFESATSTISSHRQVFK